MTSQKIQIAILALQGAFAEHQQTLLQLGADTHLIRNLDDWNAFCRLKTAGQPSGLVIPGGESTAMLRIMNDESLLQPLRDTILSGLPVFGTCAGMILLAREVENDTRSRLATMDITVRRNAYGRQLGSFHTVQPFLFPSTDSAAYVPHTVPMTFIRAPYITSAGADVTVLATVDGNIVAARQQSQIVCSFHPELDDSPLIHNLFLDIVRQA